MRPDQSLTRKILQLPELLARLEPLRGGRGRSDRGAHNAIVFTNGCFDLLHPGHVDLLARARDLGETLVVGLNSDASVRALKGPPRPVVPFADRALVLAGLASVDFVIGFDAPTPLALIKAVLPGVLVKGGDWSVTAIVGREAVEAAGGRVFSLPLLPGYSTTSLIKRINNV
jgi:rfaE bifunctional protein nucleotidyltransferase chain/domain